MIDMLVSFWVQVAGGLFLLCIFPVVIGGSLRKNHSGCFAYGVSLLLAAGASFLFSYVLLTMTISERGWGGLVFLFVFGAQGVVAVIGGLMILGSMLSRLVKRPESKS